MEAVKKAYRCEGCGNLTRFDVTVSRRSRYYHHQDIGLDHAVTVEDPEILEETIEKVTCRRCETGKVVEIQPKAEVPVP